MSKISQRDAFFNELYEIALLDKNVYLVVADMAAPSLDKFRKNIPNQFINVGVAEQCAVTVAAGLALEGKKVFVYSIMPFVTLRCLEHIKIECAVMKLPITLVGMGSGFSYDESGPTHHSIEDLSIMRAFPNMIVNNITDSYMAKEVVKLSYLYKNPNYVRLDRRVTDDIYIDDSFESGFNVLKFGKIYILATGIMVHQALEIADELEGVGVIDIHTFPFDEDIVLFMLGTRKIITLEENVLNGGLGSSVCEIINDLNCEIQVLRIGIDNKDGYCYKYGGREEIWKHYGIDKETSIRKIKGFLKEKE